MQDYKDRKLTPAEWAGVTAAFLMFIGVGMIMGGTAAGADKVFYAGAVVFAIGSAIALYLLFKYKPKDENNGEDNF
jgi:membrane protein implicated in regulation of membrane protease activity